MLAYSEEVTNVSTNTEPFIPPPNVNANIKYLWAVPMERVNFFSPDGGQHALAPDWMRSDLNKVAVVLYKHFLASADLSHVDKRDAEAIVSEFRKFQRKIFSDSNGLFNSTLLVTELEQQGIVLDEEMRDAIVSAESFRVLLGKVATDFAGKMMFQGGTKFLYQARMWAEVLGSGDAVQSHNYAESGAVAAGVVFTNIPEGTIGHPAVELLDPRGHNPPFGRDEVIDAQPGLGFMYPGWVNRLTVSHRCCNESGPADPNDLLTSHRIDWAFEIGLFQYPEAVVTRFYDLEKCPFQNGYKRPDGQLFFNLDVEELVKLEFNGAIPERISN